MSLLELGRPAIIGIIVFGAGEGSNGTEKNLQEHFLDQEGNVYDARLIEGTVAFEAQFRTSTTARLRYSRHKGKVTNTASDASGFWTSTAGISTGESGISVDAPSHNPINIYFASSAASVVAEIRIWHGHC